MITNKNIELNQFIKQVSKLAFTLAEVLIVLGIIGIVAEMTIPTLMNNVEDAKSKAGLKKAYSELAQAYTMILTDNSGTGEGLCSTADYNCYRNLFAAKMRVIKTCDAGSNVANGCWIYPQKFLSGGNDVSYESRAGMILADGTAITFYSYTSTCTDQGETTTTPYCAQIVADINGNQKPNTVGKDIFAFHAFKDSLIPYGSSGKYTDCYSPGGGSVSTGFGYAAQYIYQ